jgi:peptidoglycan/LPS O-acetylase OafA/YrhL
MIAIYIVLAVFPYGAGYVLLKIFAVVTITILISHVSYYYVESFFLSLKNKFSIIKTTSPQAG